MKFATLFLLFTLSTSSFQSTSFKKNQQQFQRVREAYREKETIVFKTLSQHKIKPDQLCIYLRAFKAEGIIEVWGKNKLEKQYKLIRSFDVCKKSGKLGPKRKKGDYQVPEGFYHINRFNPTSNYHLSLGINYPNKSDRILGSKINLGGDIFIHGDCRTIGCLPITDDKIKELYLYCVEAKNNGQQPIPVTIFPKKLNDKNFLDLKKEYNGESASIELWEDLKKGYDFFNKNKRLPNIRFLANGKYVVESS